MIFVERGRRRSSIVFLARPPLFERIGGGEKKKLARDYRVHNGEGPSLKLFWRRYACVHAILSFFPSVPFPLSPSHALVRAPRLMHAKLHAGIA